MSLPKSLELNCENSSIIADSVGSLLGESTVARSGNCADSNQRGSRSSIDAAGRNALAAAPCSSSFSLARPSWIQASKRAGDPLGSSGRFGDAEVESRPGCPFAPRSAVFSKGSGILRRGRAPARARGSGSLRWFTRNPTQPVAVLDKMAHPAETRERIDPENGPVAGQFSTRRPRSGPAPTIRV